MTMGCALDFCERLALSNVLVKQKKESFNNDIAKVVVGG